MNSFIENILHAEEGGKYLNGKFNLSFTMLEIQTLKQSKILQFFSNRREQEIMSCGI